MGTAMAAFSLGDTMSKLLVANINTGQIIFIRGLAMSVFMVIIVWKLKAYRPIRQLFNRMLVLRICCEAMASLTYITALGLIPFANVSAIQQAIPLVVTLGAALFFREQVGWRRWSAIVIGLVGVLIILRPDTSGLKAGALVAIGSMFFTASRDLATKAVDRGIPSSLISLCTSIFVTAMGGLAIIPMGGWTAVTASDAAHIAIAALAAMTGYQTAILGMRTGDVSFVSPMRYLSLIFAAASGYFVFREMPDLWTSIGAGIVIAAGIYTFYRETRRNSTAAVPPAVGPRITR